MFSLSDRVADSVSGDVGDGVLTQAYFIAGGVIPEPDTNTLQLWRIEQAGVEKSGRERAACAG